jgi:hypothetical protein
MADMIAKARESHGEEHHNAKLTESDVREIRRRRAMCGEKYQDIGEEFGISRTQASAIVRGLWWRHVV